MSSPRFIVPIGADTGALTETCRIIARHLSALADELDLQAGRDGHPVTEGRATAAAAPSLVIRSGQTSPPPPPERKQEP